MKNASIFFGFAPWIIFAVVSGPSTWQYAAVAALIASLILAVPDLRTRHAISVLDAVGVVLFAVLTVLVLVLDKATLQPLEDRAQILSGGVIAVVALGSVALGHPFTEFYAKASVPEEFWGSPRFHHINMVISAVWGVVFLVTVGCGILVLRTSASPDVFNWVIPIVLLVAAVKFTQWYPDHDKAAKAAAEPTFDAPSEPRPAV